MAVPAQATNTVSNGSSATPTVALPLSKPLAPSVERQEAAAVALPPAISERLSSTVISERVSQTLGAVHRGESAVQVLAPQVGKLLSEMNQDLERNQIDPGKVRLLLAYAAAGAETFDPENKAHQSMVTSAVTGLARTIGLFEKKLADGSLKVDAQTRDMLRGAEGMWTALCVDKGNVVGQLVTQGLLDKNSASAQFVAKIREFDSKSLEELRSISASALRALSSEASAPEARSEAYLNLAASYYKLKSEPGYKAELVEGMMQYARHKEASEVIPAASIFLAHVSWEGLNPGQVSSAYRSPQRDMILPFVAVLTDLANEKNPHPVSTTKSWETFLKANPTAQSSTGGVADTVFHERMKLLELNAR